MKKAGLSLLIAIALVLSLGTLVALGADGTATACTGAGALTDCQGNYSNSCGVAATDCFKLRNTACSLRDWVSGQVEQLQAGCQAAAVNGDSTESTKTDLCLKASSPSKICLQNKYINLAAGEAKNTAVSTQSDTAAANGCGVNCTDASALRNKVWASFSGSQCGSNVTSCNSTYAGNESCCNGQCDSASCDNCSQDGSCCEGQCDEDCVCCGGDCGNAVDYDNDWGGSNDTCWGGQCDENDGSEDDQNNGSDTSIDDQEDADVTPPGGQYSDSNASTGNQDGNGSVAVTPENGSTQSDSVAAFAQEVFRLTNEERVKNGLPEFTQTSLLNQAAAVRGQEQATLYSHTRPDGSKCFTVLNDFGISYSTAGENIAMGYTTPASVVNGWMNSSGHRANILNANFTSLGVGVYQGSDGTFYWAQLFIGE